MPQKKWKWTIAGLMALALSSNAVIAEPNLKPLRDITLEDVGERQLEAAIASRTLTWLTGSSVNNDYVSVGRIANYFGFVGLRVASGHSLSRSDVAFDTLAILNVKQKQALIDLTDDLSETLKQTHIARQAMNRALEGMLIGDMLSREDFDSLAQGYAISEARIGGIIAQRFGEIATTLKPNQIEALNAIRDMHVSGQGHLVDLKKPKIKLPKDEKKELVNTAARFLSWTTGSPEHNDFEVVGKPSQHFGFVSLRIDSNHGVKRGGLAREVESILNADQWSLIEKTALVNADSFDAFLASRSNLLRYLETALTGNKLELDTISELGAKAGAIEAEMTWSQAQAMLEIRGRLSESQAADLIKLRAKYTTMEEVPYASAPLLRGKQLFAQCALCHNTSSAQSIAPDLNGIVGRKIGSDLLYSNYSPAFTELSESNKKWTKDLLDSFLKAPQTVIPGTVMTFSGLDNASDRQAIIAYLESLK